MWLTSEHLGLGVIGLTANIGLSYSLKFLWAPVFDELAPPLWLHHLGRRRGWLPSYWYKSCSCWRSRRWRCQIPLPAGRADARLGALPCLLFGQPGHSDRRSGASRPSPPRLQGAALAGYVWGYRARTADLRRRGDRAFGENRLAYGDSRRGGAGADRAGLATLLAAEPIVERHRGAAGFGARFTEAVRAPLAEFLSCCGALVIIAFIILFRLGEALAGVMLAPYYTFLGFNRAAIAVANGPISLAATLLGAALGGVLVARFGVGRALLATALFQTAALLMYPALGLFPGEPHMLVATSALRILR